MFSNIHCPLDQDTANRPVERIAAHLPYRRVARVLTAGELAFWTPLLLALKEKYLVLCKVRLADLATVPDGRSDSARRFQDIHRFHVDFVVCDRASTEPLLVIELDDRSHGNELSRRRDRFKDAVLKAARLPVYRVACQQAYAPAEIAEEIRRRIGRGGRW